MYWRAIAYWKRGALLLLVASKLQSDLFVCLFSVGVMAFEVEEMLVGVSIIGLWGIKECSLDSLFVLSI